MTRSLAQRPTLHSFHHALILSPNNDGRHWRLVESFAISLPTSVANRPIVVPKNFVTDFASVPRYLWSLYPPWGRYGKAAIIHDYLYSAGCFSRAHCDRIFLLVMQQCGTGTLNAYLLFHFVRLGGWRAWHAHRRGEDSTRIEEFKHSN